MNKQSIAKIIYQISCLLLFLFLINPLYAEQFFEKNNTWYEPVPANPLLNDNSVNYINDIRINSDILALNYRDWSYPIWQAEADTPTVKVEMSPTSNAVKYGWNFVPIPANAKSAGMDEWCANSTDDGITSSVYRDMHMIVLSHDGKWEWDIFKARKCSTTWRASSLRKRARTVAASLEGEYLGDGSGVLPVFWTGFAWSQDDLKGNPRACAQSAHSHGLITYADYLSGSINHAIQFGYNAEKKDSGHWGHYPCLSYRNGISERTHAMELGRRLQLDPSYNCNQHSNKMTKMICEALKTYGAIFVINTGKWDNTFYLESNYGKNNFWSGVLESPLPIPLNKLRVVEPVCSDCSICPNCTSGPPPPTPVPAPVPGAPTLTP